MDTNLTIPIIIFIIYYFNVINFNFFEVDIITYN